MSLELGRIVKEQWQKIVEANKAYPEQEIVNIPLTNLEIDSKSVYLFLREFSTMLNENPNLFTLVHDGKNVLKAYAEEATDGVYDKMVKIDLDGWEKAVPLQDVQTTFNYVKKLTKEKTGIDVGLLKLAHIDFFKEFQPVFDKKNSNLKSICHMYECTRKVVDKNLIGFYPEPKLFKFLRETENIELKPEVLEEDIKKWVPNKNYGIIIRTSEGLIGVTISKHNDNLYIEFPRSEVDELRNDSLKKLTTRYRKRLGLSLALGLDADSVKGVVDKISDYSLKDKELLDEITNFIKTDSEKGFYVSINPILNFIINKSGKYTPLWPIKKIGRKAQSNIFD